MKSLYYSLVAGLAVVAGCQKEDATPLLAASFERALTLRYQQSAALPNQSAPELTITVEDVRESRCPSDVTCVSAGGVGTDLRIQDQSGASQTLTLRLVGLSTGTDSAAVQANGRRYTIALKEVTPYPTGNDVPKKDKRVVLTIRQQ